jgi:hypothetical protein
MTNPRPRTIANDIVDAVATATQRWTRQKKSEERHPGNIRYRLSRMTKEPRVKQVDAVRELMPAAYMAASGGGRLPALVRQIYYQIRPKVMAMTDDKELAYGYFSQTLLPDYIEEHPEETADWDVVYDARGHFEEPHTNRRVACGTLETDNYLAAIKRPELIAAALAAAGVNVIGPEGGFNKILYCEKEGFNPLWKAVNLANRHDVLIISNKGQSVTAARKLVDQLCGEYGLPLLVLHDFDTAGFSIFGVFKRDTRRYRFVNAVEVIDLGLRLADVEGLEREPAAASRVSEMIRRRQLAANGATRAEIDVLIHERVELNALTSDALVARVEAGFRESGRPQKVIPDDDTLAGAYRGFHRSERLREKFEEVEKTFDEEAAEIEIPADLRAQVEAILAKHDDLRWDDAIRLVLDQTQLDRVRAEREKAKRTSGDFTSAGEHDETAGGK